MLYTVFTMTSKEWLRNTFEDGLSEVADTISGSDM